MLAHVNVLIRCEFKMLTLYLPLTMVLALRSFSYRGETLLEIAIVLSKAKKKNLKNLTGPHIADNI